MYFSSRTLAYIGIFILIHIEREIPECLPTLPKKGWRRVKYAPFPTYFERCRYNGESLQISSLLQRSQLIVDVPRNPW